MFDDWRQRRRDVWVKLALAHFFLSVTGLVVGWMLVQHAQQQQTWQQHAGGFQAVLPWTYYVGAGLLAVCSFPLLWPFLVLPQAAGCMSVFLLPINSGLIGWVGSRLWWRRRKHSDRDWRLAHWQCPACGYDLTGSMDRPTCPDCGEPLPDELRDLFVRLRRGK